MSKSVWSEEVEQKIFENIKVDDEKLEKMAKKFNIDTSLPGIDLEDERYINCIGIDNLRHVCLPESDICKCGVKVKRKKMLRDDWQRYCCYECCY